jgi:hypothetical protein
LKWPGRNLTIWDCAREKLFIQKGNAATAMMRFPTNRRGQSKERSLRHCQQIHPVVMGGIVSEWWATSSRTVGAFAIHGLQSL